jgi:catechol 2,3-dioxygenase-like lactoylglutathione lyase family enzyme
MSTTPPFVRVDHLVIATRDLEAGAASYQHLLGLAPSWRGEHPALGTANVIFGLANCYLELLAPAEGRVSTAPSVLRAALDPYLARHAEGLFALALATDDLEHTAARLRAAGVTTGPLMDGEAVDGGGTVRRWRWIPIPREQTRGVNLIAIQHVGAERVARSRAAADEASAVTAVDHVVLFSDDLAGALALWRDAFVIPERWRREFPERGTVNVGLRLGGVTFELVAPLQGGTGERGERLWGVAYAVPDCDRAVERLRARSVAVSDARPGLAPATRVATVKWADRTPTLLLQHLRGDVARDRAST